MIEWLNYGLGGLVAGSALYMLRNFIKYIQALTDRVVDAQTKLIEAMQTERQEELDKISATLIIVSERQEEMTKAQQNLASSQQRIIELLIEKNIIR